MRAASWGSMRWWAMRIDGDRCSTLGIDARVGGCGMRGRDARSNIPHVLTVERGGMGVQKEGMGVCAS